MKKTLTITGEVARKAICRHVLTADEGYIVTIAEPNRTLDQNSAQWPYLEAFANQLEWPINGQMTKITADDWKDILTCAFRNESPRVAMGLNGGMVLLGQRTSKFSKKDFSEWMEFLVATSVDRGVTVYQQEAAWAFQRSRANAESVNPTFIRCAACNKPAHSIVK